MKIHRFCLPELKNETIIAGHTFEISGKEIIHQMKDVFRFETGDLMNIFDGTGLEVQAEILSLNKNLVNCKITKIFSGTEILSQTKNTALAFALLKNDHTEMVLEKCTELGVTAFQPLTTDRTIKTGFRRERLEKIITEATEQSGWSTLPQLHNPITLKEFLQNQKSLENIFVMDMNGEKNTPLSSRRGSGDEAVTILIGPEGGWSDEEREMFKDLNLQTFSLGKQTLRAETACIASVANLI